MEVATHTVDKAHAKYAQKVTIVLRGQHHPWPALAAHLLNKDQVSVLHVLPVTTAPQNL